MEFESFGTKLPLSGKKALDAMKKLIDASDEPADVGVAVSMGLGYLLAISSDPEEALKVTVMTAMKVKDSMEKAIEKEVAHGRPN